MSPSALPETSPMSLRIIVQGVGGIGGVLATRLLAAGYDVLPITGNQAVADVLNKSGFRLSGLSGTLSVPLRLPAQAHLPSDTQPCQLLLLATPPSRLEEALASSAPFLAPTGFAVCFQNGLPEGRARRHVPPHQLLGAILSWGANMPRPGEYVETSSGSIQLGRYQGGLDASVEQVAQILRHVAPVALVENLQGVRWSKLAINSAISTLGAVGGARLGRLLTSRTVRRLFLEVVSEVVEVASKQDIQLERVNGTFDLRQLAVTAEERRSRVGTPSLLMKHALLLAVGMHYRRMRSSMLYALERGRAPGAEFLNGEVVAQGQAVGVEAPINRALLEAVEKIAAGQEKSGLETLERLYRASKVRLSS